MNQMMMSEFQTIIKLIPELLQYFIPGLFTIMLYEKIRDNVLDKSVYFILSIVISYVLLSFTELILVIFKKQIINILLKSSVSILLGIIVVIILNFLFSWEWFSKLTIFLFKCTPNSNIWRDVLDLRNGSNLKIYLKDCDYYIVGHHKNHEEKDGDSWLAVTAFKKLKVNNNDIIETHDSEKDIFTIRFSDIDHLEIFN